MDCFEIRHKELPTVLEPGFVLVKNLYLSMDPTHIIWAKLIPQYMPAVGLGTPMRSLSVFEIVKTSDAEKFPTGMFCSGQVLS